VRSRAAGWTKFGTCWVAFGATSVSGASVLDRRWIRDCGYDVSLLMIAGGHAEHASSDASAGQARAPAEAIPSFRARGMNSDRLASDCLHPLPDTSDARNEIEQ
jgi:hypothetical protein